jgi:hypothetical protein
VSQAVAGSSPVVLPGSVAQRRLPLVVTQVSHTQVRVLPGPRCPAHVGRPATLLWSRGEDATVRRWRRRFESCWEHVLLEYACWEYA